MLLAAAASLPWLVPSVPSLLTALVPADAPQVRVIADPEVLPPSTTVPMVPRLVQPGTRPPARVDLAAAGLPEALSVERLSVRSGVVPISGETGTLLPPSDPQLLGWWQEGAVPGAAQGTAVLTGHTVHTGGGAFDNLRVLVPGDLVKLRTDHGTIRYAVRSVRNLSFEALALRSTDIFDLAGPGRLVLITCTNWNGTTYLANTVVVAEPLARVAGIGASTGLQAPFL